MLETYQQDSFIENLSISLVFLERLIKLLLGVGEGDVRRQLGGPLV